MRVFPSASLCALLLSAPSYATSVYRCVDEAGHVTFTQQGCAISQTAQVQQAHNPTPSSGKTVLMAEPDRRQKRQRNTDNAATPLTVVGAQDDGCGNQITRKARRKAVISQQIRAGMTRADVESALGTPDTITTSNGQTRYRYNSAEGRSRTVSFDERGCVRGKR